MKIDELLKNVGTDMETVPVNAFVRATSEKKELRSVGCADGSEKYFDEAGTEFAEADLCVPCCNCYMDEPFNKSGKAVYARVKDSGSDERIEVEPVDDNGFVFYRDKENNVYSLLDLILSNKLSGRPRTFETLADRMLYYRAKTEQSIPKNSYVLIMLDGKNFSQKIKKKFSLPFDENFIRLMNDTAAYVCSKVQGAKFAYTQSDEISVFVTDADAPESTLFFDGRLVKMLSVIASEATSYFNRHVLDDKMAIENLSASDIKQIVEGEPLYQFDCKVWTVPTLTEVWNWFLYRSRDCTRNSKIQAAQTYLPHKKLLNKHTDEQVQMLKDEKGINWHTDYNDGEKYGRFIIKVREGHIREFNGQRIPYERSTWKPVYGRDLDGQDGKEWFWQTLIEPLEIKEDEPVKKTFKDLLAENKMYCEKLLKNLSYLSDLSEQFPDTVDDWSECIIDNQFYDIKEIVHQTDVIKTMLNNQNK